jgi:perosamine synthetase
VPVVVDCEPDSWNCSAVQIEEKITSRTKALLVVHIYGLPVDMDPILGLARKFGLKVIEDAAEMHGQTYKDRPCGSFGDISTFSFYPNKLVTTGEGGILLTDDEFLAERCRSLRNLCFQSNPRFVHEELGWNARMSNLQAAVGVAQLERLDEFVSRKRKMGAFYTDQLRRIAGIGLPIPRTSYAENIYWVYGVVLDDSVPFDAHEAMERLATMGIGTRPFFWPMHEQPVFKKMGLFAQESHPNAERLARRGFYVPSGVALTEAQAHRVVGALREILR